MAVGNAPEAINLGDVDGDGDFDFVVTNFNAGTASVRLNNGTGPLATAPATRAELLDPLGRVVRVVRAQAGTATLEVTGLAPGLYVVRAAGQAVRLAVE